MSTTVALFKGFAATVFAGITAISFTNINKWILFLAFIPVVSFWLLDTYYFQLEKKYRILYEKVRTRKKEPDFNLDAKCTKSELYDANGNWVKCMFSFCISWFYIPLSIVTIVVIVLKFVKNM